MKVIFLDAVGTLFGVRGSVGELYAKLAQKAGVDVSADVVDQAFFASFKAAPSAAFPGIKPQDVPAQEFQWWYDIAAQTFQRAGVFEQFQDFDEFFADLYNFFAGAEPWFVYGDVRPSLEVWHHQGFELGVISNFDSRLYEVLKALKLADFFSSITISTEVGAAKPAPEIFKAALEKHDCLPQDALHIGDSYKDDYQGAKAVGLQAIWLKRGDLFEKNINNEQ